MTKASVIIGSYNQKNVLNKVLDSFNDQAIPGTDFEVIVADSTSNDGTQEFLKSYKPKYKFKYIILENKGKAAARNAGVWAASSDIIIITDSDMVAEKNFVEAHVNAHKKIGRPACFEGLTYNMSKLTWPIDPMVLSPYIKRDYKNLAKLGYWFLLTGNLSFPKSIFVTENGFDEKFTGYGWEDIELGYRFSKKKIPIFYLKDAINYHYHVVSDDGVIERNVFKGESAKYFLEKHPELKWFLGANPLSILTYKMIKKNSVIYKLIEKCYSSKINFLNNFGLWFLNEHHYLQGLID